jgi:hypothetical protein
VPEGLPLLRLSSASAHASAVRRCCLWRRWTARSASSKRKGSAAAKTKKANTFPRNSAELSDGADTVAAVLSDDAFAACQTADVGAALRLTQYTAATLDGKTCVSRQLCIQAC